MSQGALDEVTRLVAPALTPDARTRLGTGESLPTRAATPSPGRTAAPSSGSGWLSSSGSIDHGRFSPGVVLDGRYRIIGLLGRGGMGEVFRADDLRLGQPVALKFLPEELGRDPIRLAQFHNEVRTARHVSHPSICRVHDIGEVDGLLYLSMEYVDGEDLATSLRRIGRFPEDKALEIARQICAGLAAAHERGVLHRDLKPANIMLDGAGRVRIMDFSLAAIGEVSDIRAGTPAYMAPEQLAGQEVTVKSDLFALGLVLYELFTGRRAFQATTIADLVAQHDAMAITAPTTIVPTIELTVERAIMRCLDPVPARRPSSALAVSAALPGGDPLAAALAAGETPSPEMVAAAGGEGAALSGFAGAAWLALAVALIIALGAVNDRVQLPARLPIGKPTVVLADRASELRRTLGYVEPYADSAEGYRYDADYLRWASQSGAGTRGWSEIASGRPSTFVYWRRTSPITLVPFDDLSAVGSGDPPNLVSGMTLVEVDGEGRLFRFIGVPNEVEAPDEPAAAAVNWAPLFASAGLDEAAFSPVASQRTPRSHSDERRAWEGPLSGTPHRVRIEASAYRGRVVGFEVVGPWSRAARQVPFTPAPQSQFVRVGGTLIVVLLPLAAAVIARRNVRSGRADRSGAIRLSSAVFAISMMVWALQTHIELIDVETGRFWLGIAMGLFNGALLGVVYLALEPFVRRHAPDMLITWSRVISGRVLDPRVGRDLLFGIAFGTLLTLGTHVYRVVPFWMGWPEPIPTTVGLDQWLGPRQFLTALLVRVTWALQNGMIGTLVFAMLRQLSSTINERLGRRVPPRVLMLSSVALSVMVFVLVSSRGGSGEAGLGRFGLIYQAVVVLGFVMIVYKLGLFASVVAFYVNNIATGLLVTLDPSRHYAAQSWAVLTGLGLAAAVGFWLARQARPPGRALS